MEMTTDKNKLLGLAIIAITIVLGVLYAVWILLFNKGQVIFEGVPPFNVYINGKNYTCLEMQCEYKVSARQHSYTISKEGYIEQSGNVSVLRGKSVVVSYDAVFEAQPLNGVDYPMLSFPVGYSKYQEKLLDISLFHSIQDGYQLQKMPKKINGIEFSSSGNDAILFEDEMVSHYKTDTFDKKMVGSLSDAYSVSWNANNNAVYSVVYDDASKKDALIRVDLSNGSTGKDVYFLRDIDKYSLAVSPDEKYVCLVDETSDMQTLYMIDRDSKSRTNIFEGYALQKGTWSKDGNYYIFSGKYNKDGAPLLWLFDVQASQVENLKFNTSPRLITATADGKFYFVSTEEYSLSGSTRPYFSDFKKADEILTADDLSDERSIGLHMFDARAKQTYLILELTNVVPAVPSKIEINDSGSILRMLAGDQYFDVKVGE